MSPQVIIGSLNPILGTIFAVSLFVLWHYHRDFRYIALLGMSYAARTAGYISQYFALEYDDNWFRFLANSMFMATAVLFALALTARFRQRARPLLLSVIVVVTMGCFSWFLFADESFEARVVIMNAGLGAVALIIAVDVARVPGRNIVEHILLSQLILVFLGLVGRPLALVLVDGSEQQKAVYWFTIASSDVILSTLLALTVFAIIAVDVVGRLKTESTRDPLSGLLNRRGFALLAHQAMERQRITGRYPTALVCDLDHFKTINDRFGHAVGDHVIQSFAEILLAQAPTDTVVARMGGEEFAVLFPQGPAPFARLLAEAVRNTLAAHPRTLLPSGPNPTASFGIATSHAGESLRSLLDRADQALYRAKRDGRDCVRVAGADPSSDDEAPPPIPTDDVRHVRIVASR